MVMNEKGRKLYSYVTKELGYQTSNIFFYLILFLFLFLFILNLFSIFIFNFF